MRIASTGYIVALALLACNVFVAAEDIKAPASPSAKVAVREASAEKLSPGQLVEWLLESGQDFIYEPGTNGESLGLPFEKLATKARGTGKANPYNGVQLVLQPQSGPSPGKPECLLFLWSKDYRKTLKHKSYYFRFTLNGKLERAISVLGTMSADGRPVRSSGVNTVLDIEDPEVQERAQAEMDFWLERAAMLIAQKKAAEGTKAPASPSVKAAVREAAAEKLSPKQLVEWLLESGQDFAIPVDTRFELLNLPFEKLATKIDSLGRTNPFKGVQLVLQPASGSNPGKPECLLFLWSKNYLEELKTKSYDYRFSLDGKLERAISAVGKNHAEGKPIRSSGVNTVLDIEDPEVQERAQAELDFWLERAAMLIAQKKAAPAKKDPSPKRKTASTER